jgi:TrmH family RNA methyltransferase
MGWEGAFLVGEGCDPFNEKALRAARGATFRLPLRTGSWDELQALATENHWVPLVADLDGKAPSSFHEIKQGILVLSNESHGPSDAALRFCQKVSIPMSGKMESLNVAVAGGILMYALKKK